MNDNVINEIVEMLKNYTDNPEVVKVSDFEYRIADRIRDLKFVFVINIERLTYKVQCFHIDEFTFIYSDEIGRMISNFKVLHEICERIEVILKKFK